MVSQDLALKLFTCQAWLNTVQNLLIQSMKCYSSIALSMRQTSLSVQSVNTQEWLSSVLSAVQHSCAITALTIGTTRDTSYHIESKLISSWLIYYNLYFANHVQHVEYWYRKMEAVILWYVRNVRTKCAGFVVQKLILILISPNRLHFADGKLYYISLTSF